MRVICFDSPAALAERVTPLLVRREAENNFLLGKISEFRDTAPPPGTLLLAVEDERAPGGAVVAALMTPPRPLVVTRADRRAIDALVGHLAPTDVRPVAMSGPEPTPKLFARAWSAATAVPHRGEFGLGLFQLDDLVPPPRPAPGAMRIAAEGDIAGLVPWAEAFFTSTHHAAPPDAPNVVSGRGRRGQIFLWCDPPDRPVAMAAWAGPTPSGVRINFVFTPPEHRNRGYATACVASRTRRLFDSGRKFCFLFTDLANPTSNRIYQSLGYRHVCDFRDVRFEPAGDSGHHPPA